MRKITGFLLTLAVLSSCSSEDKTTYDNSGSGDKKNEVSITGSATKISAVSAVLNGKANLGNSSAEDLKVGFQYSTSPGILPTNSNTVDAQDADADYNYIAGITGLSPDTRYYFRSYVRQNGQYTYGDTKEFTTQNLVSMLETQEATDIEASKATLNAKLDLTDVQYKNVAFGFLWENTESSLNIESKCTDIEDNAISASLTSLSHKTQYWYKAFVTLDDQTFHGEVKTFTTGIVSVESVALDKTEYTFITIGNTLTLNAIVSPADATDKSIEWTSDNEDVATVSASGIVTAKGNGTATITVTTKNQGKTANCVITVITDPQLATGISLDKTSITLYVGEEETLIPTVNPSTATIKTVKWTSSDESVATVEENGKVTAASKGTATIKAEANDGSGVSASCIVVVKNPCPAGAVDLGLSVYWTTTNLGAANPEDYGDYYAWGETEAKENYGWETYKFRISGNNISNVKFSKYNTEESYGEVDNKNVLDQEDDVAHVKLGGNWRMPTEKEWDELIRKCTWTWTKQNGVSGYKVSGSNGNSIFLPAAGRRRYSNPSDAISTGRYWSSSLDKYEPRNAQHLLFESDSKTIHSFGGYRCFGFSVRPVTE